MCARDRNRSYLTTLSKNTSREGHPERDHSAHRMPDDDGALEVLIRDERQRVLDPRLEGVVELATPLRVAMPPLVQREDVEPVGEMQAHQVPRVGRLVAA